MGEGAAAQPFPMLVEFGTEMNGYWFPWNGKWNGAGATLGYGDLHCPMAPSGSATPTGMSTTPSPHKPTT